MDLITLNPTERRSSKDLASYAAKDNILVNAVCPGPIRTPLWEGSGQLGDQLLKMLDMSGPEAIKWFAEQNIPMGHHGDPEDIANLVAFPASDRAKFITGQAINFTCHALWHSHKFFGFWVPSVRRAHTRPSSKWSPGSWPVPRR